MHSVVHVEIPDVMRERMATFYERAFGWQTQMMGEDMGNYVVAITTESGDAGPQKPGAINGGFFKKDPDCPPQYPSVVIAVDDLDEAIGKVRDEGGEMLGEPMDLPGVGKHVAFNDTGGNKVAMLQPLPRSTSMT